MQLRKSTILAITSLLLAFLYFFMVYNDASNSSKFVVILAIVVVQAFLWFDLRKSAYELPSNPNPVTSPDNSQTQSPSEQMISAVEQTPSYLSRIFSSTTEAEKVGWTFSTPMGMFGTSTVNKYANINDEQYEYVGLSVENAFIIPEDVRLFGRLLYKKTV